MIIHEGSAAAVSASTPSDPTRVGTKRVSPSHIGGALYTGWDGSELESEFILT